MRVGILVTSIGNFGQKGFYNTQEIGLARAMAPLADEVKVYKLVAEDQEKGAEAIEGCRHASISFIPSRNFGINGLLDTGVLDNTLDALIYFSDTQLSVPRVFRWARKNHVRFLPYIGVIESHSTSKLKKLIVDWTFGRNLKVYKKSACLVKTPTVESALREAGVNGSITVTPVGLDMALMKADYEDSDPAALKVKHGYAREDKVVLFIGRLIEEKQPVRMIEIFAALAGKDDAYRLLMVGTGEMKGAVVRAIETYGLNGKVRLLDRIPNSDIWELYRLSEAFVNLNQQEIFGMAILEAMYYGCKVVAWEAPGPKLIIENGISGWLVSNNEQVIGKITDPADMAEASHDRIVSGFTWHATAQKMMTVLHEQL